MEATRPAPDPGDARAHVPQDERSADAEAAPSAPGLRCPYCHDALSGLAGDCVRCGTRHHLACFADHGGCSTHGCGSTRATSRRPGATNVPGFAPLACTVCNDALAPEAMVARCDGCSAVLHVGCYEHLGACRRAGACAGAVEVMPHVEAAAIQLRRASRALLLTGLLWLLPMLGLVAVVAPRNEPGALLALALVALVGLLLAAAGLVLRGRAGRLAGSGAPRPPRAGPKPPVEGGERS